MRLIDISPLVSPATAVWPGDVPYSRQVALSIADGDNLELSSITSTVHIGAHTDAPSHYEGSGADIASRDLSLYYGPVDVMTVDVRRGERITPAHLPRPPEAPRVLFHTQTFPDPNTFTTDFAALSPELVDWLADRDVVLVGLDTPSVDLFDDAALISHHAIARRDLAILEGVVLAGVADGVYTLAAFPLRLAEADASPVRAVLIRD